MGSVIERRCRSLRSSCLAALNCMWSDWANQSVLRTLSSRRRPFVAFVLDLIFRTMGVFSSATLKIGPLATLTRVQRPFQDLTPMRSLGRLMSYARGRKYWSKLVDSADEAAPANYDGESTDSDDDMLVGEMRHGVIGLTGPAGIFRFYDIICKVNYSVW
ncbi:hypothetical protein BJY01DRAFT_200066 [Aspergillus pseudoustus]|uniref:Uncharacterized protein n=1 Tax=Aspergillus pseudoustus TaxID=1810923 RepID=A0ABR4JUK0_9EURO